MAMARGPIPSLRKSALLLPASAALPETGRRVNNKERRRVRLMMFKRI